MKKLILLILAVTLMCSIEGQAQVIGKKMPVGVKFYEVDIEDPQSGETITYKFADVEGQYDVLDFNNLDSALGMQKRSMVFDPKMKTWRLPLNAELTGIIDPKKGELQKQIFNLGKVRPSLRHQVK